jgi:hypothetical protein
MRSGNYESDCFIRCFRAVGTGNVFIIPLFSANAAVQVYDDEVPFYRAGIMMNR